ncbi:MAG TPA: hypothetical protein ENK49_12810 [Gammaproteobacteria bacterium]|nr:hypothetical protein [Gammaproteobacteria bacterium]
MAAKLFLVSLLFLTGAVQAGETIRVYQLDGSIHCREAESTGPDQAAEVLKKAGVKVLSSSSRTVPFALPGACGTPTGKANVLVVDADDWKKMTGKHTDAPGFGVWIFDRPLVEVYKYDGSLQCQRGSETSLEDMARELSENGIEVKSSRKGTDGRVHISMCGASTGRLNVYSIATESLPAAQALGFELLVTRKMTGEIAVPPVSRRAPALSRTPRSPGTTPGKGAIPKLW